MLFETALTSLGRVLSTAPETKKPDLGFNWKNSLAPVKNTFIHYDTAEWWAPPDGSRRRSASAPAVLAKAKATQFKMEGLPAKSLSFQSEPRRTLRWCEIEDDGEASTAAPSSFAEEGCATPKSEKVLAHDRGTCRPCAYLYSKEDGCRHGEECEYCHLCTVEDVKNRKRQVKREARTAKRAAATKAKKTAMVAEV
eukprot:CAMPEP_0197650796 /NCGR_PEP_ID=MMETSP1338-20131121/31161_1 /TAXON_ID=43686 ORGANISM="Pelagodinium beii, Strain RCC1491" /NCGR_SAMPLE_ID=MMETSP1338 /ASSEMBLY_ACC=CAM_ASM_000754 /LENGTH=195 /DNA_ID=CAMNT_0043225277 /DNA_START=87 /DNA_END=674 /DNA_ORIENTATION=+